MIDQATIKKVINQTDEFYKKHAEEFSKTRQDPWSGWEKCLGYIRKNISKDKVSVLDVACGNGRFYKYLTRTPSPQFDYLGLDNNDYLLVEAVLKYQLAEFKNVDVFFGLGVLDKSFDVVSVFGLTHHIPGNQFRVTWLKSLIGLINPGGLLMISFWNLAEDDRFAKAELAEDLEENDYYYGWGDSEDKRYVHIYPEEELNIIELMFEQNNLKLVDSFYSDGKNKKLNKYLIFKRL
jgi:tRNA (uracil-5-)-methyltransferase TRM9